MGSDLAGKIDRLEQEVERLRLDNRGARKVCAINLGKPDKAGT